MPVKFTLSARPGPVPGCALLFLAMAIASGAAQAAMTDAQARRLAQLSLEDLMSLEVTSVAGTAQTHMSTPAALTVITAEDIRRAGHRHVADALRLVPGMYVGRVNASSWVVGSRGLAASTITANRYLVLIDGRVAHDPLLSSTFWDTVDLVVDDIDRIEVIRGPGATLWGANAMNGVISIITRDSRDTSGTMLRVGAGSHLRNFAAARHTRETGTGAYRVWGKYSRRGDFENAAGASLQDEWSSLHGGFRADGTFASGLNYSAQGELHSLPTAHYAVQQPVPGAHLQTRFIEGNTQVEGGHLMMSIGRDNGASGWSAQAYYETSERRDQRLDLQRDRHDIDFRHWFHWGGRNETIWGLQYDQASDRLGSTPQLSFERSSRSIATANAFIQNTTELVPERLFAMVGSKFSHHDFVGFHMQPSARLWWTPSESQTLWGGVSRPLRVPSRFEENGQLNFSYVDTGLVAGQPATGIIVPLALAGNDALPVEKLLAWEVGHRLQLGPRWHLDTTVFYNDYQRLISVPVGIFGEFNADGSGTTRGADVAMSFQATRAWRLEGSYSLLKTHIDGPVFQFEETSTPRHLGQLRSVLDVADDWELNAALYHVGDIPRLAIDSYERVDLGLTWRASPQVEFALWGQNLTDPSHPEASAAEVPRSVYLQMSLRLQ